MVLIGIQFIRIDKTAPVSDAKADFFALEESPDITNDLVRSACYDCHSYESKYPWYTNIAPMSWWIKGHINGGRQHLNFSEWGTYEKKKKAHKLEEIVEELTEEHMPLSSYTWMHPKAKLSADQRAQLIAFFDRGE